MRLILFVFIGFTLGLSSCKKSRGKFEGTFSFKTPVAYSSATQHRTSPITITQNASGELNFVIRFAQGYPETLTATFESNKKATIAPIENIGVMPQGGYELYGGTLTRKGDEFILELDVETFPDPNGPYNPNSPTYVRHIETYVYKKD